MRLGLNYTGVCKGIRVFQKTNRTTGEQYPVYLLGLSRPVDNGYENQENIFEIQLGKKAIESGLHETLKQFQDKTISVPIFQQSRAYKDRVYTDTYLGIKDSREITVITPELKKVG